MNDVFNRVAADAGIPKKKARRAVRSMVLLIREAVTMQDRVTLTDLGTFRARRRRSKTIQNFAGERFTRPSGLKVSFSPSRSFKSSV